MGTERYLANNKPRLIDSGSPQEPVFLDDVISMEGNLIYEVTSVTACNDSLPSPVKKFRVLTIHFLDLNIFSLLL